MRSIAVSADSATEKATKSDCEWFARNPHRSYRVRPSLPGEFPGKRDGIDPAKFTLWTIVKQIKPGVRARLGLPVRNGAEPIDADWTLAPLFECLLTGSDFGPDSAFSAALVNAFLPPAHVLTEGGVR